MTKKPTSKGFSTVEVLVALAVVAVIGLCGFYVYHHNHTKKTVTSTKTQTATTPKTKTPPTTNTPVQADPYAGWKSYSNQKYGFAFKYPSTWKVEEVAIDAPSGSDPIGFAANLEFDTNEKDNGTAEFEVHNNNLAAVTNLQDSIYAQTSLSVTKKDATLKGKRAVEYDVSGPTVSSNLYLFSVNDKTYSFGSAIESYSQQQSPTYRADFAKVFDSLTIQ